MTRRLAWLTVFFLVLSCVSPATASQAPTSSLRPDARPGGEADAAVAMALTGMHASLRPRPRPLRAARPGRVVLATAGAAVRVSIRPGARPRGLRREVVQTRVREYQSPPAVTGRHGAVCGDRAIRGQTLPAIPGKLRGCGVANPIRLTEVDGVALTQPATLNCDTAKALKHWVKGTVKPAVGRLGGGVASLKVVAHYSCRTRNNVPGAKISEHGRGNAIDIAAINLKNGVALTVLKGWRDRVQSKILKKVHAEACGTFGTVLGPNADRYHQDHFHLDVARHRGGAYCR